MAQTKYFKISFAYVLKLEKNVKRLVEKASKVKAVNRILSPDS